MDEGDDREANASEKGARSVLLNEDWMAAIVGLALLVLALLGLIPDAVVW